MALGALASLNQSDRAADRVGLSRAALALRPTNAGGWNQLGAALSVQGDSDGALAAYREALRFDFRVTLLHAVYAGWIIALLVWMLPAAETAKIPVIVLMTWLIGVGGFAHVVAGSSEVFYAAWRGEATWGQATLGYILPSLIGNMAGGITLVAAVNHAQVTES
jgi:formate/nitrite transporter FocA (FNT family)